MRLKTHEIDVIVEHLKRQFEKDNPKQEIKLTGEDKKTARLGFEAYEQIPEVFKNDENSWRLIEKLDYEDFEKHLLEQYEDETPKFNSAAAKMQIIITTSTMKTLEQVYQHYKII